MRYLNSGVSRSATVFSSIVSGSIAAQASPTALQLRETPPLAVVGLDRCFDRQPETQLANRRHSATIR